MFLIISEHSVHCHKILSMFSKISQKDTYLKNILHIYSVDNAFVRNIVGNKRNNYNVAFVPTLLIFKKNGLVEKFEKDNVLDWFYYYYQQLYGGNNHSRKTDLSEESGQSSHFDGGDNNNKSTGIMKTTKVPTEIAKSTAVSPKIAMNRGGDTSDASYEKDGDDKLTDNNCNNNDDDGSYLQINFGDEDVSEMKTNLSLSEKIKLLQRQKETFESSSSTSVTK